MKLIKKLILPFIILIIVAATTLFALIKDKPEQIFDINNQNNTYLITKDSNYFWIKPINQDL